MGKWVRTKTEVRVDGVYDPMLVADDLAAFGYEEERIPVTILPTADADEALRLLERLRDFEFREGWDGHARLSREADAFLAKVKG